METEILKHYPRGTAPALSPPHRHLPEDRQYDEIVEEFKQLRDEHEHWKGAHHGG